MDPAFANVLRRVPSNGSYAGTPLRQTVLGRSIWGADTSSSMGVSFKEVRPPSIVGAPEVLVAELGDVAEIPEKEDDGEEYIGSRRSRELILGARSKCWKRTERLSCRNRLSSSIQKWVSNRILTLTLFSRQRS